MIGDISRTTNSNTVHGLLVFLSTVDLLSVTHLKLALNVRYFAHTVHVNVNKPKVIKIL